MSGLPDCDRTAMSDSGDYVLYCFDSVGIRLPPETLVADDDEMAIALVRLQLHKNCEVWQGTRLVFVLPEVRAKA